jgi:hypothetical protein
MSKPIDIFSSGFRNAAPTAGEAWQAAVMSVARGENSTKLRKPSSKREGALASIRIAGFHNDSHEAVRVRIEKRIGHEAFTECLGGRCTGAKERCAVRLLLLRAREGVAVTKPTAKPEPRQTSNKPPTAEKCGWCGSPRDEHGICDGSKGHCTARFNLGM